MTTGHRIILTRGEDRNQAWAVPLAAAGHEVVQLSLIRYEPVAVPEDFDPARYDWILFTSPQAVKAFVAAGWAPTSVQYGILGAGTAAALARAGLPDDLKIRSATGAELARAFAARIPAPGRVLLPGAAKRLSEPGATLTAAGFAVTELALYETCPQDPAELPAAAFRPGDIVFFCSPSTVRAFTGAWSARPRCVAIGETTARAARAAGFATAVAATPDLHAMVLAAGLDPLPETVIPESES
jgi:uroporphyrinogen-III synthase